MKKFNWYHEVHSIDERAFTGRLSLERMSVGVATIMVERGLCTYTGIIYSGWILLRFAICTIMSLVFDSV